MLQGLKWEILRCFSSTGEASSPEDYHWLSAMAGYKPVMEYCGGTEIGGGFLSGTMVQPQAPSHFSTPTIGSRLALIDDQQVLFDSLTGGRQHTDGSQQLWSYQHIDKHLPAHPIVQRQGLLHLSMSIIRS